MAIGTFGAVGGPYFDRNDYEREMHYRREYERRQEENYRRQEEEYRRLRDTAYFDTGQQKIVNQAPKPDPKDPLAFLKKSDSKLLLTGKTS